MSFINCASGSLAHGPPSRSYYQVLEISPGERDTQVIEEAALRCSSRVRVYQLARALECAKELCEIAQALNTLLDPVKRREYDRRLSEPTAPEKSEQMPPATPSRAALQGGASATEARPHLFRNGNGKSCDVALVYRRRAV
jgi:DnaJ-class molecular chaperone